MKDSLAVVLLSHLTGDLSSFYPASILPNWEEFSYNCIIFTFVYLMPSLYNVLMAFSFSSRYVTFRRMYLLQNF